MLNKYAIKTDGGGVSTSSHTEEGRKGEETEEVRKRRGAERIARTLPFNSKIVLDVPEPIGYEMSYWSSDQDFQSKSRAQCSSEYPSYWGRHWVLLPGLRLLLPPLHSPLFRGWGGRADFSEGLRGPRDGTEEMAVQIPSLNQGNNGPIKSVQAWHSHERHIAEKCHRYPGPWPCTVCSVSRGWSKGGLGTEDRCLLKMSQDSKATRTLFKDVALPLYSTWCLFSQWESIRMKHTI